MSDTVRIINWIASYPKSGNTWVRFMLLNLIYGPQQTTRHLDSLLPDIHKCAGQLSISTQFPVLIKTHYMLSPTMPLYDNTARFIYIVRHPMDTMMSNMNYVITARIPDGEPDLEEKLRQQYVEEFITLGGDPNWIKLGLGTWIEHVRSWIGRESGFSGLTVRYEDLLSDPIAQLYRVNEFLSLQKPAHEIERAVGLSVFSRMKNIEEHELSTRSPGFFMSENSERTMLQGRRFMHRGKAGEGEKELTREKQEMFMEKFGAAMELAGYGTKTTP